MELANKYSLHHNLLKTAPTILHIILFSDNPKITSSKCTNIFFPILPFTIFNAIFQSRLRIKYVFGNMASNNICIHYKTAVTQRIINFVMAEEGADRCCQPNITLEETDS